MLPGFRFLFAAILLTMSVLVFGLGAAALLRASHEQFANSPARRTLPEPVFAQSLPFPRQQNEAPVATLAMLRVDPPLAEKTPESAPVAAMAAPAEAVPDAPPVAPVETERLAALKIETTVPAEMEKSEAAPPPDVAAIPAPVPSTEAAPGEAAPAPAEPVKIAAVAPDVAPAEPAPAAIADLTVSPAPESMGPPAKVAALSPAATTAIDPGSAKPKNAEADRAKIRKRLRAQRAKERRRLAAQRAAREARQAAAQQQQAPDAFAIQPTITTTAATSRRR